MRRGDAGAGWVQDSWRGELDFVVKAPLPPVEAVAKFSMVRLIFC